jgi:CBS domain-containing protein
MRDEDTGIVPIVENKENRKLIGVVTDRDLCLTLIAEKSRTPEARDPAKVPIEHCMTSELVVCEADDDVDHVLELMKENQVRRILVVDGGTRIKGIVSLADLMNRASLPKGETSDTLKTISTPTPEASKPRAESARTGK